MNLKDDKQQNIQKQLDFSVEPTGESREAGREETESFGVTRHVIHHVVLWVICTEIFSFLSVEPIDPIGTG